MTFEEAARIMMSGGGSGGSTIAEKIEKGEVVGSTQIMDSPYYIKLVRFDSDDTMIGVSFFPYDSRYPYVSMKPSRDKEYKTYVIGLFTADGKLVFSSPFNNWLSMYNHYIDYDIYGPTSVIDPIREFWEDVTSCSIDITTSEYNIKIRYTIQMHRYYRSYNSDGSYVDYDDGNFDFISSVNDIILGGRSSTYENFGYSTMTPYQIGVEFKKLYEYINGIKN